MLPFESREAGEQYFENSTEQVEFISLEEASQLAYLRHRDLIELAKKTSA